VSSGYAGADRATSLNRISEISSKIAWRWEMVVGATVAGATVARGAAAGAGDTGTTGGATVALRTDAARAAKSLEMNMDFFAA